MSIKPIIMHGHAAGPNPNKVAIIFEELEIPYEHRYLDFSVIKQEPFISLNPNGRLPAIEDPNTGLVIWESGAIIDYIVETYDKNGKFALSDPQSKWLARSFRDFQMSGQGPYTGQRVWFTRFHPEKIQSAVDRYANEVKRMIGVIDAHLAKQGTDYLIGDKVSYADLMFVPWYWGNAMTLPEGTDLEKEFPKWSAWWGKLTERESVKKVHAAQQAAMAAAQAKKE